MKKTTSKLKRLYSGASLIILLTVAIALSFGVHSATTSSGAGDQQIVQESKSDDIDFEKVWTDELTEFEKSLNSLKVRVNETLTVLQGAQVDFDKTVDEVVAIDGKLSELHGTLLSGGALNSSLIGLRSWVGSNIDRINNTNSYTEEQKTRYIKMWDEIEEEAITEEARMLKVQLKLSELRAKFKENHRDIIEFRRANRARIALATLKSFLNEVDQMVQDVMAPKIHGTLESIPSSLS